jgi:hypothetical protein
MSTPASASPHTELTYLSRADAAAALGVSLATLKRRLAAGQLPVLRQTDSSGRRRVLVGVPHAAAPEPIRSAAPAVPPVVRPRRERPELLATVELLTRELAAQREAAAALQSTFERELEARRREVAELHALLARQSQAQLAAVDAPPAASAAEPPPAATPTPTPAPAAVPTLSRTLAAWWTRLRGGR